MVSDVYDHLRRRKIKSDHYRRHGLGKIMLIKYFWMVYNKIFLYTSESTRRRNMGQFYGILLGITT